MTTLRHRIRIDAPLQRVWRAVADLAAVQHYNPTVAAVRIISDKSEGIGAARRCDLRPKGWVEERVWHWNPPDEIGLEVAGSTLPVAFMKWKTELYPDGMATLVTQETEYKVKFGVIGTLMDALMMRPKIDRGISEVFGSLKRHVETLQEGAGPGL